MKRSLKRLPSIVAAAFVMLAGTFAAPMAAYAASGLNTNCSGTSSTAYNECMKQLNSEIENIAEEECKPVKEHAPTADYESCKTTHKTQLRQAADDEGRTTPADSNGSTNNGGNSSNNITAPPSGSNNTDDCGVATAIIKCPKGTTAQNAIFEVLGQGLVILTWGVGIGATIGFVLTGYQYITAGGNVGQTEKAKRRMLEIVIGLAIYFVFWGVMNWLLPGGLFGDGS